MSIPRRPLLSVVTPCRDESDNVGPCYLAVKRVFAAELPDYDYEHIFADNASTDDTAAKLRAIAAVDPRVKIILNSRNFGPLSSAFNAMLSARGDAVIPFLPADLQDPPEVIPEMVRLWKIGFRVVYGIRQNRQEALAMRAVRHGFYVVIDRLSDTPLPIDAGEFQLLDRVVVDALRGFEDHSPYLRGMIAYCGFPSAGVPYNWRTRTKGKSKANLYGMFDLAMNAFVSFSNVPIRVCLLLGVLIASGSISYSLLQLALVFFLPRAAPGVPTLVVGMFFLGGVQLFFLGILGEYVSAIHSQVRKRPLVIEAERINFNAPKSHAAIATQSERGPA